MGTRRRGRCWHCLILGLVHGRESFLDGGDRTGSTVGPLHSRHGRSEEDGPHPPFSFVQVQGIASLSEDPDELLATATRTGGRYMGPDKADEYGRRNGVPGELVVRVRPTKVLKAFGLAG
jgi:hypothetical protein